MKVTGMFAAYAEVQNGMLYVSGGYWTTYALGPDRPDFTGYAITVATTTRAEREGGPPVTVALVAPDGSAVEMLSELILPGTDPRGDEAHTILVGQFRVTAAPPGVWTLRSSCGAQVDESHVTLVE